MKKTDFESKKRTSVQDEKNHNFCKYSQNEIEIVQENPELTSKELAELLPGRSSQAVRHIRMKYGRYVNRSSGLICCVCAENPLQFEKRVVWSECQKAKRLGLCKEHYLDEMEKREKEQKRADALRQREYKKRKKGKRENN